jgi:hypothetical protein
MKKLSKILVMVALLISTTAQAETPVQGTTQGTTGQAATTAQKTSSDSFAWGIGLGATAVLCTVAGVAAVAGASSSSTSH